MKILRFKQFLKEAKQVGIIYHITTEENAIKILRVDTLGKYNDPVSLTRDKNFNYIPGRWDDTHSIKFVLDGNKVSNNYKIGPYSEDGYGRSESEERTDKPIKPLSKYLIGIEVLTKIDNLTFAILRKYATEHNIKVSGKGVPKTFDLKDQLKEVEGYWLNGKKVKNLNELIKLDKEYYSDWEEIDIGYLLSQENVPHETVRTGVIFVEVEKENPLEFIIYHDSKEKSNEINKIFHLLKDKFKEAEISSKEIKDEYDED